MTTRPPLDDHPLVRALDGVASLLDEVSGLDPRFVPTQEKMRALRAADRLIARLEGLRLDLLGASSDVADESGARSAGVWLALESRRGASAGARDQHDAQALARRPAVLTALRDGVVNAAQAGIIVRALDALPGDLEPELVAKAESQLLGDARHFAPRELRVLGRRVFEVISPAATEAQEASLLAAEERRGRAETRVTFRPRGVGVTDVWAHRPAAPASHPGPRRGR